jgi:predicted SAM-dependent methyltransferase
MNIKNVQKKVNNLESQSKKLLSSKEITHGLKRALRNLSKEIRVFRNHTAPRSKIMVLGNSKVQIGGGTHYLTGFVNIDILPPADIIFDVREGIPLPSGSVEFIFSEHFLEHVDYPISAKKIMKEAFRVIRKNGKVVISVPDSERVIGAYVKRDKKKLNEYIRRWYSKRDNLEHFNTAIDVVNYHFRDQDDSDKYASHLWGYDKEKLKSLLKNVGFHSIREWEFDPKIANPKRKFGSIYIEGKK